MASYKCDSCGATFDMNDGLTSFKCTFCGVTNLLETTNYDVHKYTPGEKMSSSYELDLKLKNANYLLTHNKDYDGAYKLYKELFDIDKTNIDVLDGLLISLTHDFNANDVKDFDISNENDLNVYLELYEDNQKNVQKLTAVYKKYNKFIKQARKNYSSIDEIDKHVDVITYAVSVFFAVVVFALAFFFMLFIG